MERTEEGDGTDGHRVRAAVAGAVEAHGAKVADDADRVNAATQGLSFPVPTADNPLATFEDLDARQEAQARLDARRLEEGVGEKGGKLSARKRKLLRLQQLKALGRSENQKEVAQEHHRLAGKVNLAKLSEQERREVRKKEREEELRRLGAGSDRSYLLETAERAEHRQAAKRTKVENITAAAEAHALNDETTMRQYEKRVAALGTGGAPAANAAADLDQARQFYGDGEVSSKAIERMAQAANAPSASSKRRRNRNLRARLDEEDVTAINDSNEKFNQTLRRDYDKHTVELRSNMERGTAL
ncbi:Pre-mRNA-splicing factor syf2 [Durusdinium trenchii]|uniref:Pre-mRNA-splicing factor SYF2 n=1 Tax=Durusdinium trenchii TaxID=1381693 RepID=A0ABP0RIN0_9DINO